MPAKIISEKNFRANFCNFSKKKRGGGTHDPYGYGKNRMTTCLLQTACKRHHVHHNIPPFGMCVPRAAPARGQPEPCGSFKVGVQTAQEIFPQILDPENYPSQTWVPIGIGMGGCLPWASHVWLSPFTISFHLFPGRKMFLVSVGWGRFASPRIIALCDIPSGCCFFTGPWTVTRSSLRMLRRVAAFCRPLRPVLLLVSFPRPRSPVVGVPGLCWMWRDVPFARQRCPVVGVLGVVLVVAGGV